MSQIRQANLKFLPVLTKQQVVIGNRCSQNSQSLDRAITRESQTHDVDVCGVGKAYNMVAKRVNNNRGDMASLPEGYCSLITGRHTYNMVAKRVSNN